MEPYGAPRARVPSIDGTSPAHSSSNRDSPRAAAVGDGIASAPGKWSFGGALPRVFERHARRSIPGYDELHASCLELLQNSAPARLFDLGCSTGTLTRRLTRACPSAAVIGVDREPGMIEQARASDPSGSYMCSDLTQLDFGRADAIFALYVLQFLPEGERLSILTQIRESLAPRGLLVIAEKVRAESAAAEAEARAEYHAFKRAQGFTEEEILAKEKSLRGILIPLTAAGNERQLRLAGFTRIDPFFTKLCFRAWVAYP